MSNVAKMTKKKPSNRVVKADLSSLRPALDFLELGDSSATKEAHGVIKDYVYMLPIDQVHEDPDQPRTEFNETLVDEIAKSIEGVNRNGEEKTIDQPIQVRIHPTLAGEYMIVYGGTRYRATQKAGKKYIPATITETDEVSTLIKQLRENLLRNDLETMDLAHAIHRLLEMKVNGEPVFKTKSAIAEHFGKKPNWVTYYLSCLNLEKPIQALYDSKKCMGAKQLYEFNNAYKEQPAAVTDFLKSVKDDRLTNKHVDQLKAMLTNKEAFPTKEEEITPPLRGLPKKEAPSSSNVKKQKAEIVSIKHPLLMVKVKGKLARLDLHKKLKDGKIMICYDVGGMEAWVNPADCVIEELKDQ